MNKGILFSLYFAVATLGASIGFMAYHSQQSQTDIVIETTNPFDAINPALNQIRPDFELPDINGRQRKISEWDGKVILLNFWASWCPPCIKEVPALIEAQNLYQAQGFQVVGVALDKLEAVKDFGRRFEINYPSLYGQNSVSKISLNYGNQRGTLPYTVIIARDGVVRHIYDRGDLELEQLKSLIEPLL